MTTLARIVMPPGSLRPWRGRRGDLARPVSGRDDDMKPGRFECNRTRVYARAFRRDEDASFSSVGPTGRPAPTSPRPHEKET